MDSKKINCSTLTNNIVLVKKEDVNFENKRLRCLEVNRKFFKKKVPMEEAILYLKNKQK